MCNLTPTKSGGAENVSAMLKGGCKRFPVFKRGGPKKFYPVLMGGGAKSFGPTVFPVRTPPLCN